MWEPHFHKAFSHVCSRISPLFFRHSLLLLPYPGFLSSQSPMRKFQNSGEKEQIAPRSGPSKKLDRQPISRSLRPKVKSKKLSLIPRCSPFSKYKCGQYHFQVYSRSAYLSTVPQTLPYIKTLTCLVYKNTNLFIGLPACPPNTLSSSCGSHNSL